MKIYIDGKLIDKEKAVISVFDHGLLYGDGVFEGIRTYDGLGFRFKEHIDRLYRSADAIELKIPMTKEEMVDAMIMTLKANKLRDAYIRLVVTRGPGDLGLDPRKCSKPTIFIITYQIALYPKEFYQKGLEIITANTRRNYPLALDPRIKSLNYLNNILAKIDAIKAGTEEAIMLNYEGYVTECTGDNIFMVKDGELITSPVSIGALEGITRDAVIGLARKMDIPVFERLIKMEDIYAADEVFLTGTAAEIIPVVRIDKKRIGGGKPGGITLRLTGAFKELTKSDGVRYDV
ncbi:MAG: branched-chain-amino-acid transaminase [Candidatus Omnitrophica bacterium]|nr:branched-chain-amino-acid transaminase [Candidatus Omnitrophota bacterium]MDD5437140.1 branched-chain-amino-acid transaminase [Candidatus Omnitrophota bacterium]